MEIKRTFKRTFKIPVSNLTKKDAEKLIRELINQYEKYDSSFFMNFFYEYEKILKQKNRLSKLNKIWKK